jgi:hypothetical protein
VVAAVVFVVGVVVSACVVLVVAHTVSHDKGDEAGQF